MSAIDTSSNPTIIIGLLIQTIALIGLTYIYAWLYNHTQSVFLVIIFHALTNVFNVWLLSFLVEPQVAGLLMALMPWFIVLILKWRLGKERFPGHIAV